MKIEGKNIYTILSLCFFMGNIFFLSAQDQTISGFIYDQSNGETLIGATIFNSKEALGTISNEKGYFSLRVPPKTVLQISYLGYQSKEIQIISPTKDSIYKIELLPASRELNSVEIYSPPRHTFGITTLNPTFFNTIPSITGKPDVMKALQYTPGIQTQGELSSVIMVRGGNAGENQYLLDNVPLIYVHHLGGFFSVFNPDMINSMSVYKGNFPASLGGKLSSYIDVSQKKGSNSLWQGNLSIGLSDLSFAVEGPLNKDMTLMLTGRKTLIELLSMLFTSVSDGNDYIMAYGFHDINAKFSWQIDPKNLFQFNAYEGDDYLSYWRSESYYSNPNDNGVIKNRMSDIWGNLLFSAKLQTNFSSRIIANNSLSYTRYRTRNVAMINEKTSDTSIESAIIYRSKVQDLSINSDWGYKAFRYWDINWGAKLSWVSHSPNEVVKNSERAYLEGLKAPQNALDLVVYTDQIIKPFSWMNIRPGLRLNYYGLSNFSHFSATPRISIDFPLPKEQAISIGYYRLSQTSQMVFVPGQVLNNEIWFSSDKDIPVAFSNQYNIGWKGYFYKRMFEAEVGLYYKTMSGLSGFKDGYQSILGDPAWKDKISVNGKGRAYGVEVSFKKNIGKITGLLTYTYARSFRQFNDINKGKEYIFEYDRPHTATLSLNWAINKKWSISCSWIYQTGLPYTPAVERVYIPNTDLNFDKNNSFSNQTDPIQYYEALIYGQRNSARMKDYHRLDLGAQYNHITKKGRRACLSFSIYNVYARKNPAFYFYNEVGKPQLAESYNPRENSGFKQLTQYQLYYLSLIPMISYKIWFDSDTEKERRKRNHIE